MINDLRDAFSDIFIGFFRAMTAFWRRFWQTYGIGGLLVVVSVGVLLGWILPSCSGR